MWCAGRSGSGRWPTGTALGWRGRWIVRRHGWRRGPIRDRVDPWKCAMCRARASACVVTARALRSMPLVEAAMLAGDLTMDHVRLLAKAQATAPEAFAEDGEERLIGLAGVLRFSQFETAVRYWCHRAARTARE